ncbi:MAG: hypothetical protein A2W52_00225 [Candidatus Taylorbacteria bacterium RIFCSPHIGHO2_02_49_25]|uniref:Uncharacterized protein n=1 Tax=Candidatus Taylorbacteria bacterium RIFCSPHIGHO2_02_49_25 TaxID=1802305 RepID=A0A1G2MH41_9BACT|nr:MAG: hypothetical protein A2W52_00225 [Candidatus Taylorbacteria bacterium RIFCSPHIGHO2_02_49_25]
MLGSVAGTHSYLRLPAFPSAIICDKDATPPVLPTFEFFTLSVSMTKRNNIGRFRKSYGEPRQSKFLASRYPFHHIQLSKFVQFRIYPLLTVTPIA